MNVKVDTCITALIIVTMLKNRAESIVYGGKDVNGAD